MVFIYCAVASLLSADQNLMAPNLTCVLHAQRLTHFFDSLHGEVSGYCWTLALQCVMGSMWE
jgi:hypothetical protein